MDLKYACEILNVTPTSSEEQIRRAYLKRALLYHPDRNTAPEATQTFQSISAAYTFLKDYTSNIDGNPYLYDDSTSVHEYKNMFEVIYNKYSVSFSKWMQAPEIKLLKTMYSQIKNTFISTNLDDNKNNTPSQHNTSSSSSSSSSPSPLKKNSNKYYSTKFDIIQTLHVSLEEIYNRTIKKVTIYRFRWSEKNKCTEQNSYTVLVPTENACVCFPNDGDSDEQGNVGNLYFVILNSDKSDKTDKNKDGVIYRDTNNPYILRCTIHITPYDMCYGGGEYYIKHYNNPIRLKVGSHFYNRCHKPIIVPDFGLWNPTEHKHDSFVIDIDVCNDSTLARKVLFQSLYKQQNIDDLQAKMVVV